MVAVSILIIVIALGVLLSTQNGEGTIEGKVSIGPWTPVEPPEGSPPPPEVYTSRKIVLEGTLLNKIDIPLNGTGYFHASVRADTYRLTMTNCTFLGCKTAFPKNVSITPGKTTYINIDVDTGIR
jgi:hypothetical protein